MSHYALPALPTGRAATMRRTHRDRRDGVLALAGLALASAAFGAVVSGDPVPVDDAGASTGGSSAGLAAPAR